MSWFDLIVVNVLIMFLMIINYLNIAYIILLNFTVILVIYILVLIETIFYIDQNQNIV